MAGQEDDKEEITKPNPDEEGLSEANGLLTLLVEQLDSSRDSTELSSLPAEFANNHQAARYHRMFRDALHAAVAVLQMHSQGLDIPEPDMLCSFTGQSTGFEVSFLFPMMGKVVASFLESKTSDERVRESKAFLAALPSVSGIQLDRFVTKLATDMARIQMNRFGILSFSVECALKPLEDAVLSQMGMGETDDDALTAIEWADQLAGRLKAQETFQTDPESATAILHGGVLTRAILEHPKRMKRRKRYIRSPEEAADALLGMIHLRFDNLENSTSSLVSVGTEVVSLAASSHSAPPPVPIPHPSSAEVQDLDESGATVVDDSANQAGDTAAASIVDDPAVDESSPSILDDSSPQTVGGDDDDTKSDLLRKRAFSLLGCVRSCQRCVAWRSSTDSRNNMPNTRGCRQKTAAQRPATSRPLRRGWTSGTHPTPLRKSRYTKTCRLPVASLV